MTTFAERLQELRYRAKLAPEELAQRAQIPSQMVYSYLRGASTPGLATLQKLAEALEVSLAEFQSCRVPEDRRRKRSLIGV